MAKQLEYNSLEAYLNISIVSIRTTTPKVMCHSYSTKATLSSGQITNIENIHIHLPTVLTVVLILAAAVISGIIALCCYRRCGRHLFRRVGQQDAAPRRPAPEFMQYREPSVALVAAHNTHDLAQSIPLATLTAGLASGNPPTAPRGEEHPPANSGIYPNVGPKWD